MLSKIKNFIKSYEKDVILVAVVILVALISFGLGRLSKIKEGRAPITIQNLSTDKVNTQNNTKDGAVVASKNGTKYHYPWCSGAATIKEENRITFNSTEEARQAGYLPASNCKGLE
jgi:hypothetical protein